MAACFTAYRVVTLGSRSRIKILIHAKITTPPLPPTCSVEHVETVFDVARGVGVDHVEQDRDAKAVSLVDETLEVLGTSEPAGGGEEGRHLITEGRRKRREEVVVVVEEEVVDEMERRR